MYLNVVVPERCYNVPSAVPGAVVEAQVDLGRLARQEELGLFGREVAVGLDGGSAVEPS